MISNTISQTTQPGHDTDTAASEGGPYESQTEAGRSSTGDTTADVESAALARAAAAYAGLGYMSCRRGVLPSDGHLIVLFDNNPYRDDPHRRGRQLEALKAVLAGMGVAAVAEAAYPADGQSAGYTVAMVFKPLGYWQQRTLSLEADIVRAWEEVIIEDFTTTGQSDGRSRTGGAPGHDE